MIIHSNPNGERDDEEVDQKDAQFRTLEWPTFTGKTQKYLDISKYSEIFLIIFTTFQIYSSKTWKRLGKFHCDFFPCRMDGSTG